MTLFRNTPLLMIFIFMAIAMPKLGYTFKVVENFSIAGYEVSSFFFRSCLALTLYTSAFVCEALRSGVNAVPLGQAEAGRAIGLTFTQSMRLVVLPQAIAASIPPMTSVQVALIKNTSVAAAFGMAEAVATMRSFTNNYSDQKMGIFLAFAIGYIIIVEVVSLVVLRDRAEGPGGPMSASILFDAPGPKTVARHRLYSVVSVVALVALVAFAVWRLYDRGQLEYELWEPFVTPQYIEFILVDGLLRTLQMAFFSIIFAVVFGLVFGVGQALRPRRGSAGPPGWSWSSSAPRRCCC